MIRQTVRLLSKIVSTTECVLSSHPGVDNQVSSKNFEYKKREIGPCGDGEVLCETLYLTVDPYMRCMMDPNHPQLGEYLEPYSLNKPLHGGGVGRVIDSKHSDYKDGDIVVAPFLGYDWGTHSIAAAENIQKLPFPVEKASHALGAWGMPGLTAYFCMLHAGKPKSKETVVISGAAGACGTVAGQLAKLEGARVIGICGSKAKCEVLTSKLGFDKALCYKDSDFLEQLTSSVKDSGIDVYFDNVGGELSDNVVMHMNKGGRVPICGQIAVYSKDIPYPPPLRNDIQQHLDSNDISRFRFLVLDYQSQWPSATKHLVELTLAGKLIPVETVIRGFQPGEAFVDMMSGGNTGKAIVKVV